MNRVLARVEHKEVLSEVVDDFHLLGGHGARLAKAEVRDKSNLLDRLHVSHEHVVIFAHQEDAVGEGDGYCHGETLRDGHDEDDEGDDDTVDELLDEDLPANIFVSTRLYAYDQDGDAKDDEGAEEADELEAATDVVELLGELSLLLPRVKLDIRDASRGGCAHAADKSPAGAAHEEGVGVEEGRVLSILVLRSPSHKRGTIRLVNAGRLLHVQIDGGEDEAVGRDLVAGLQLDDISDDHLPDVERLHGSALATQAGQVLVAVLVLQLYELGVFGVVVPGRDQHPDEQGAEDGDAFHPARLGFHDHAGDHAEDRKDRHKQNDSVVQRVLEGVAEWGPHWPGLLVLVKPLVTYQELDCILKGSKKVRSEVSNFWSYSKSVFGINC